MSQVKNKTSSEDFIRLLNDPIRFRMFLLFKIPSAYFSGVRIKKIDRERCVVTVPYKWFSQNPFRSIYFACLAMAAELSTGSLALVHLHKLETPVSMLVTGLNAKYFKKATGLTTFTCEQGRQIKETIQIAIDTGVSQQIVTSSMGKNEKGEPIAEFKIEWSFKVKTKKK
jgi:hypothetical protein